MAGGAGRSHGVSVGAGSVRAGFKCRLCRSPAHRPPTRNEATVSSVSSAGKDVTTVLETPETVFTWQRV